MERDVRTLATLVAAALICSSFAIILIYDHPRTSQSMPHVPTVTSASVVFIGSPTGLAGDTYEEFRSGARGSVVEVTKASQLLALVTKVNGSWVVLFNSAWLVGQVQDSDLHAFFAAILYTEAKIVAVGDQTSLLFETLNRVDPTPFEANRNPAYDNPPLAGYKLRHAVGPNGVGYFGESVLISISGDPVTLTESILLWT